jgi:hypothetical protein
LLDLLEKKHFCQQHEQLDTIVMVGNLIKRHFYGSFYVFGLKFSRKVHQIWKTKWKT